MGPWLVLVLIAGGVAGQAPLVRNGSFEQDVDQDGVPDAWRWAGDSRLVTQSLGTDTGRDGQRCAKLVCTAYQPGTPAAHAMLCQMDVPVRRGPTYRLTFWAKGDGIADGMVSLALSDTKDWTHCGLQTAFLVTPDWRPYEFLFHATHDCPVGSRLQFWFHSPGTLWVDDVVLQTATGELYRPGQVIGSSGAKNLVPNASFECGTDGWGSAEWDRTGHWGGPMNRLFGQLDDRQAVHGQHSLRIELSPEHQPVSYFDYYELYRVPIRAPLAANLGFLEVSPGKPYVLSVFLKADAPGVPARLAVRQFQAGSFDQAVTLSTDWQRFQLRFTPQARWCYVLAGPDLRPSSQAPQPPKRAVVWLDALQLEAGQKASDFAPRQPVEFGLSTERVGNVFTWDESLQFAVHVAAFEPGPSGPVTIEFRLTDFFDQEVWHGRMEEPAPIRVPLWKTVRVAPDQPVRGFLRLEAQMRSGGASTQRSMRLAAIPPFSGTDSRFGVNHAYPWGHLLDLCFQAGLVWVRDWSLKWQTVEPEQGRFDFTETDFQINRPLEHKLRVLGLLPFPSANWSSSAPAQVVPTDRYPQNRARVAYAPRDVSEFERYVATTVSHYKDRVTWWQVFNEPLYTDYSLPRERGYTGKDYAYWVQAFSRAARRADPQCRILAGIGGLHESLLSDFEQFFAAGGLEAVDAVDVHYYPQLRAPEFIERRLEELNRLMDRHGPRRPIWCTEYGYYADDEPWCLPTPTSGFDLPLATEQQQAEYAVRWAVLLFASGVEKVFYHAGTCDGVNRDSLQGIFFEYGGQPHKIYAAQAVMASLLTPETKFVRRLDLGPGVRAYLFAGPHRVVGVVWAPAGVQATPLRLTGDRVQIWDLMGRVQSDPQFRPGPTPVYLIAENATADALQQALRGAE